MNRILLVRLCDSLVLAVLSALAASFSWVVGLVVAALGFYLVFLFKPRRKFRDSGNTEELARLRDEDCRGFLDSGSLQNRHWYR